MTPEERLTVWVRKDEAIRFAVVGSRHGEIFVRLSFLNEHEEVENQMGYGLTLPAAIEDALARAPE